jgi:hypothetical protein
MTPMHISRPARASVSFTRKSALTAFRYSILVLKPILCSSVASQNGTVTLLFTRVQLAEGACWKFNRRFLHMFYISWNKRAQGRVLAHHWRTGYFYFSTRKRDAHNVKPWYIYTWHSSRQVARPSEFRELVATEAERTMCYSFEWRGDFSSFS